MSPTAHLVQMFDSTIVRAHVSAAGSKGGKKNQALGRSRGGFSTKIHLKTDFDGLPIAFHLTGGPSRDSRNFETLLDIGPDITPGRRLPTKATTRRPTDKRLATGIFVQPFRIERTPSRKPAFSKVLYKGSRSKSNRRSARSNASAV